MEIESSEISMLLSFTMFYIPAIWHDMENLIPGMEWLEIEVRKDPYIW
jgi:hypothetical protein